MATRPRSQYVPILDTPNPWYQVDRERVFAYSLRSEMHHELAVTNSSFHGHTDLEDSYLCPCKQGRMWYRPTVGAHVCPACHDMVAPGDGAPLSIMKMAKSDEKAALLRAWIRAEIADVASRTTDQDKLEKLRVEWKANREQA